MTGPDLKVLAQWVGSSQHGEVLTYLRGELIKGIAHLLSLPPHDPGLAEAHLKVKLRLELLVDLRLDTIDAQVLSSEAVSRFESQLPSRIDYLDNLRTQGESSPSSI